MHVSGREIEKGPAKKERGSERWWPELPWTAEPGGVAGHECRSKGGPVKLNKFPLLKQALATLDELKAKGGSKVEMKGKESQEGLEAKLAKEGKATVQEALSGNKIERSVVASPRLEEEEANGKSIKKPKGVVIVDATMDEVMAEKEVVLMDEEQKLLIDDAKANEFNSTRIRPKLVSYMDKVLCLNGDGNESENEEESWMDIQRREEEEEDLPDEVGLGAEEDPLCPTYVFSRKQHKEDCKKWRKAVILKLIGKRMASRFLMARLNKMWNLVSTYELTDLDNGHLLLRFKEDEDYIHVLQEGPWVVADHYVIVQRWRPFFNRYKDDVKKLAV